MTRDEFNEVIGKIERNSVKTRSLLKKYKETVEAEEKEKRECSNKLLKHDKYYETEKRQILRDILLVESLKEYLVRESMILTDLRSISPSILVRGGWAYLIIKYRMGYTTTRIAEREGCDRKTIQRGISKAKDFLYTTQWEYDQFISKENISKVAIRKVEDVQYFISLPHWFERVPGTNNIKKDRRRTIHIPSDFEIIKSHMDLLLEIVQTYGYVLFDTEVIPDVFTELLNINDDAELRTVFEDRDKFTAILEGMARELTTDKEGR